MRRGIVRLNKLSRFLMLSFLLFTNCTLAQQNDKTTRPSPGSVSFGAQNRPQRENLEDIERFRNVFVQIAEEVVPWVVSVIPTKVDTVLFYNNPFYRQFEQEPGFDYFFGPRHNQSQEPPLERRERRQQGLGSGVIVSKEGYILTNYHVIAGASEVEVRLSNSRTLKTELTGFDSLTDLAVLKITDEIPQDLPVAYLGNSDSLKPGDWVTAVGNPFSLTSTVTVGIVSALGRQVGDQTMYQDFIQTDAAINPGNSGGALVNIYGELVGINTLIYSQTGGFIGIGFAIPLNMAKKVMEDIIYQGRVTRGWIGVSIQDLTTTARNALGIEHNGGVLVSDVFNGQPAYNAGIIRGDVIVSIGGKTIGNSNDLRNTVADLRPGETVAVEVIRDMKTITLRITIEERVSDTSSQSNRVEDGNSSVIPQSQTAKEHNKTGIRVSDLTDEIRERYNIPSDIEGVFVLRIEPHISDARTSLTTGDIILQVRVGGEKAVSISSEEKFVEITDTFEKGDPVLLLVRRNGNTFFLAFEFD
ncbi:Do family serine endopeptidase [Chitinispirillales bacterium ANBcel5]|uniref:Do family serine endopeptidase n=1 Tax=Cellulosispirillum alkaliphilum TaxID=3039283 RepID=UPI002A52FB08|nr:Do family serine endopeptidase [Chitinispirillales bacterium ANBcel5]